MFLFTMFLGAVALILFLYLMLILTDSKHELFRDIGWFFFTATIVSIVIITLSYAKEVFL